MSENHWHQAKRGILWDAIAKARKTAQSLPPLSSAELMSERLAGLPRAARRLLYQQERGTARPEVAQALISRALQLRTNRPAAAEIVARRALECGLRMLRTFPCRAVAADVCTDALSHLANLARIRGDFTRAERLWRRAGQAIRQGTGDVRLLVDTCRMRASLARAQRKFPDAIDLLRLALKHNESLLDLHGEGVIRHNLGVAYSYAGEAHLAAAEATAALELLDPCREPRLYFRALHNCLLALVELGECRQALHLAAAWEILYRVVDEPYYWQRFHWLLGRAAGRLGSVADAEALLNRVRFSLRDAGQPFEAALATLDLAWVYAKHGGTVKVRQLVEEAHPVFVDKNLPVEAAQSLALFAEAAKKQYTYAHEIETLSAKLRGLGRH